MRFASTLTLFIAFIFGLLLMRVATQEQLTRAAVKAECNYHEGYSEGYRDRAQEERIHKEIAEAE